MMGAAAGLGSPAAAPILHCRFQGQRTDKSGWNDRPRFAGRRLRHGSGRPVAQSYKRKEPVVKKNIRFIGLDVHGETIAVGVAEPSSEVRSLGVIPNRPESVRKLVKKLGPASSLRACYEAGPCGYVLYWQLTQRRPDAGLGTGSGTRGAARPGARARGGEEGSAASPSPAAETPAEARAAATGANEAVDDGVPGLDQEPASPAPSSRGHAARLPQRGRSRGRTHQAAGAHHRPGHRGGAGGNPRRDRWAASTARNRPDLGCDHRGGGRDAEPLLPAQAADGLHRGGLTRALQRRPYPAWGHHQDRKCAPAPHSRRGGLVLPVPTYRRPPAASAPGQTERGGEGDLLEGAAPSALSLRAPRRTRQAEAAGGDGGRPRARWFHLGGGGAGREAAPHRQRPRSLEEEESVVEQSSQQPSVPRKGGPSVAKCDRASAPTRALSPRQLPTDHDHDGEPRARSANIRVINRRACRPAAAWPAPPQPERNGSLLDGSFHIRAWLEAETAHGRYRMYRERSS